MPSGGGGLVSTAEDYYRFAQMLAEWRRAGRQAHSRACHGEADDFEPCAGELLTGEFGIGNAGDAARLWLRLRLRGRVSIPPEANLPDGKGTFFWDGAAGTWFWVDPTNDIVFVGMIQRMLGPASPPLEYRSRQVVYGAFVDPSK